MAHTEHEPLIDLLRAHPEVALGLLGDALPLPDGPTEALAADVAQVDPVERRADLVLRVGEGRRASLVVIEVQTRPDPAKRWTWPLYLAAARDRARLPCALLVVTLSPRGSSAGRGGPSRSATPASSCARWCSARARSPPTRPRWRATPSSRCSP